jgi:peptidoglycan-associated lipoprotein
MIPVQRGRGGWVNSRSTLARAMAIVSVGLLLAIAGCSSKKPAPIGGDNGQGGTPLGEGTTNGTSSNSLENWRNGNFGAQGPLSDIHFGYNDYTIQDQDGSVLKSNAEWLQKYPQTKVQVEGHCDERGSEEYNIALGAKRAQSAKDYLVTLGVSGSRISTISYGKELPLCQDHDESCWAQNRRDHFAVSDNKD